MATIADLKFHHRIFTENYPFGRYAVDDNPAALLQKPLSESRIALITTAGLRLASDEPFDNSFLVGDPTFRVIPSDADISALVEDHSSSSFDHSGVEKDRNLALPIERFRELEKTGSIGSLNRRHLSFMGSIISPSKLIRNTAPEAAELLREDNVDIAFLVPV